MEMTDTLVLDADAPTAGQVVARTESNLASSRLETESEIEAPQGEFKDLNESPLRGSGATLRALSRISNRNHGSRQIITERADQIKPRKLRWLWPERIPLGKITVFAGLPGEGKSLATVDITARVTTGSAYPDVKNPLAASEVLLVAEEDDPEDALVPRLLAANADRAKAHILRAVRVNNPFADDGLRLDLDVELIEKCLEEHPEIRLVVIDPISNHLGGISMVDEQEVRKVLTPLQGVARTHNVAIICVMHLNKKEGISAIHRVSGAGAFVGVARASWLFAQNAAAQSNRYMMPLKNNYAKEPTSLGYRMDAVTVEIESEDVLIPRIEWLDELNLDVDQVISTPAKRPPREEAQGFLRDLLANGPIDASQVRAAAIGEGISERTLDRAKAALGVESRKGPEGWEWILTSDDASKDAIDGRHEVGAVGTLGTVSQ